MLSFSKKLLTILVAFCFLSCTIQTSHQKEQDISTMNKNKDSQNSFTHIWRKQSLKGFWGYVDEKGKEIITPIYTKVRDFNDGFAVVRTKYTWALINTKGNHITSTTYSAVRNFSEGRAGVKKGYLWGLIDENGLEICPPKYTSFYPFSNGRALVEQNRKWGFIDRNGLEIIPLTYDYASPFSEGLARVDKAGKKGFINTKGEMVIPLKYSIVNYFGEGLAYVYDKKNHFINSKGKTVFLLPDSLSGGVFNEGLARVSNGYKYGYIDKTGKIIVPLVYNFTIRFSEGLAAVKKNKKWGFIDKNGNTVIPFIYDEDSFGRCQLFDFKNGYAQVMKGDSITLIDKKGKEIRHIGVINLN